MGRHGAAPTWRARCGQGATLAHQADGDDHGTGDAGHEGQPHPTVRATRSAQDLFPLSDFTRLGCGTVIRRVLHEYLMETNAPRTTR